MYCQQTGQKKISKLCATSRNTVKKYIGIWNSLNISYEEFIAKSDSELAALFFLSTQPAAPNPHQEVLEARLSSICKALGKKGMTLQKQWDKYIADHPDDRLDDFQLAEISREYMEKMGFGEQPYVVYKHNDIDRTHVHIVASFIDRDGRKVK